MPSAWSNQAEEVGASHFGVGDGPLLFSDPYQYLALASRETSRIKLGTWVTNPLTRIAPVTANSIATLNALAPGRVFVGMGTANNALRSMGNRPATMQQLEQSLMSSRACSAVIGSLHNWLNQDREIEFLDTQRPLVQHRRPGRHLDGRRRTERPGAGRPLRRRHHLLPRAPTRT